MPTEEPGPPEQAPQTPQDRPLRRALVAFVLGVVALAGPAIATDPPAEPWSWTLLFITAALGSFGAVEMVYGGMADALLGFVVRLLTGEVRGFRWVPRVLGRGPVNGVRRLRAGAGRLRARLRGAWANLPGAVRGLVPMAVILVVTVAAGLLIPQGRLAWDFWRHGCRPPPTLRVLTTPESFAAISALATVYEQESATERNGCAAADLYVYAADPETVREALPSGWSSESLRSIGPRPDVWLPDSTVESGWVEEEAQNSHKVSPIGPVRSIAISPVVLGLPAEVAKKNPGRWTGRTWAELLAEVEKEDVVGEEELPLVRPDPTRSMTGAIATEVIYRSVAGAEPQPDGETQQVDPADAWRKLERKIGQDLDRGAYPLGDAQSLLCRYRSAGVPIGAVLVTEQELVRYNQGRALGASCPFEQEVPANKNLIAVYPKDTVPLNHPIVELRWPNRTDRQVDAVDEWSRWLSSEDGWRALNDIALRPSAGKARSFPVVEPLTAQWGARSNAPFVQIGPSPDSVRSAVKDYGTASRPARTLVLLDTSGSMATPADTSMATRADTQPETRFDAAREALRYAVERVTQRDQVGLWTFPAGSAPSRTLVPIASRSPGDSAAEFSKQLGAVVPKEATPLYRAIERGLTGLDPPDDDDDRVRTLIVITDGEDTDGVRPSPAEGLAARASEQRIRISIVALGEASCTGPALQTLSAETGGDCVDAGTQTLGTALVGLFDAVGGGRGGN